MKIRKATLKDSEVYAQLREENVKEYSKIIGKKITSSRNKAKKELVGIIKDKKRGLLFAQEKEKIIGYVLYSIIITEWNKFLYVDDIFVKKEHRREGIGKALIDKLIEIMGQKGIKKCRLGVSIKNNKAFSFYKKLGFKTMHYEMDLDIK